MLKHKLKSSIHLALLPLLSLLWLTTPSWAANTAVMLIDMQKGFRPHGEWMEERDKWDQLVEEQAQLLKWAKDHSIPVIVLEYDGAGPTVSPLKRRLGRFPGDQVRLITKQRDGGFEDPTAKKEILKALGDWNVDQLIVCGINGKYCVKATVRGAINQKITVDTAPEIVGNFTLRLTQYPANIKQLHPRNRLFRPHQSREEIQSCARHLTNSLPVAFGTTENPFASFLDRLGIKFPP